MQTNQKKMQQLEKSCFISTSEELSYPPVALSLGEKLIKSSKGDQLLPIPICTYSNITMVQAPPKSKKTFFISLLASVYLSGKNRFGSKIRGHRNGRCLIHFDTEQGAWHTQRVAKRIVDMSDKSLGCYYIYSLRSEFPKTRIEFIEYCLKTKENIGLVIIDGIADLCMDVNSLEEANYTVQKLMEWSAKYCCHIITVIHSNYGSEKATGHLGSALMKKVETEIQLEQNTVNKEWITVKCKRSRNYSFETFSFTVNELGLPYVNDLYDPLA
tara:strand:+ start:1021 stop:1833 length:813 start_codon:yes stop_codon:yes gene_type:complete